MRLNRTETLKILTATGTGAGTAYDQNAVDLSVQVVGSVSTSTGTATVFIQTSNDGDNWVNAGTISLALTTSATSDGFVIDAPWDQIRANVNAISGTNASVTVYVCRGIKA